MSANGHAVESFEDVERELRLIKTEYAEGIGEVLVAVGRLTAEVSNLHVSHGDLRRAIIERGSLPPPRPAMDTGSYSLVEAWGALKEAASDKRHPLSSDRARAIAEKAVNDLRAAAELSTWRRIKAMPGWAAQKAFEKAIEWTIPLVLGGIAVEVWRLLHR
jgi:hypothetical protein